MKNRGEIQGRYTRDAGGDTGEIQARWRERYRGTQTCSLSSLPDWFTSYFFMYISISGLSPCHVRSS